MEKPDTPTQLASAAGISIPYASQILANKRTPARALAIHIMRRTGWRHSSIASLTDDQIAMLETVEPYRKPSDATSIAA